MADSKQDSYSRISSTLCDRLRDLILRDGAWVLRKGRSNSGMATS